MPGGPTIFFQHLGDLCRETKGLESLDLSARNLRSVRKLPPFSDSRKAGGRQFSCPSMVNSSAATLSRAARRASRRWLVSWRVKKKKLRNN